MTCRKHKAYQSRSEPLKRNGGNSKCLGCWKSYARTKRAAQAGEFIVQTKGCSIVSGVQEIYKTDEIGTYVSVFRSRETVKPVEEKE